MPKERFLCDSSIDSLFTNVFPFFPMNLASVREKRARESERGAMAKHSPALAVNKPLWFFFSNTHPLDDLLRGNGGSVNRL